MTLSQITNRADIGKVLNSMGLHGSGAEIGVAFGENAESILDGSNLKTLFLVDPWAAVDGEDARGYGSDIKDFHGCFCFCKGKLSRFGNRAEYLRMPSVQAASLVVDGSLDFVYIDANHASPQIDNDLAAWWPKVKSGGIFGGHDFCTIDKEEYRCDVEGAVRAFFTDKDWELFTGLTCDSWYVQKP